MQGIAVQEVVDLLGDDVQVVVGTLDRRFARLAPLSSAPPDAVTFCRATGDALAEAVGESLAAVVLCRAEPILQDLDNGNRTLIGVPDPRLAFIRVVEAFFKEPPRRGVQPTALIHPEAKVHVDTYVGPYAVVEQGCEIDGGCVIHGHVYLYPGTRLGRNVVIHAGTVIGADGFGYQRNERGGLEKFPHVGGVLIEDNVEIGAKCTVDRGTLGDTVVGQGTKIDDHVHIAHNVIVGRDVIITAHTMIAGSTRIGDRVWLAPCACLLNGLTIGAGATVGLGAVVVKDVPADTTVMGTTARPMKEYKALLKAEADLDRNEQTNR
ncbi:MAG: UDP-3-O-(3-hydroxymyristoyl)glucosamine N-acyltransferase [Armatimonadetes bacterium]|nr:UDP-3-O-(3-hydroxymyristoyl)glucosamine N-acyltransferase [Armatimonadota bacterium]